MKPYYNKTSITILAIMIFFVLILCSCSAETSSPYDSSKINVLCTGFSQYDWARNISNNIDIINVGILQKHGVDAHSYQPSADDVIMISQCDIFIYTGGESDRQIIDIINSLDKKPIIVNMMNELESSLILVGDRDFNHHMHNDSSKYDEHIWLSLKNAKSLCKIICDALISASPENAEVIKNNTEKYIDKISDLDKKYEDLINDCIRSDIVFADRFPFGYLAKDYNLNCYCAFPGCSAETDASFETVLSLAAKIDELGLTSVMTIDNGMTELDEAIISNTKNKNIKTLSLNSLQSVSESEIKAGLSYLIAMEDNLKVILESLN